MKEKYQILHLTPATSPPDTLRPGRPKDPIPRGVCLAASAPFDRREARIRENNGKKSEGTLYFANKVLDARKYALPCMGPRRQDRALRLLSWLARVVEKVER